MVATEPVECADAEGNMGLRVGGLLVAMVGLKVTLRAGRSGFLARRGVDSACVAMMKVVRVRLLRKGWRDGQISTHAFLFQYEWSRVTEQANQGTILLDVPEPFTFPSRLGATSIFSNLANTSLKKESVLCIFIHHCPNISLHGFRCLLRSLPFLLYGPIYVCIV
jgi:hypothetical protein